MQLVKLIGDAAMLVGPDAAGVVAAAAELVRRVAEDAQLPELRAGLAAGPALNRAGDWYGETVNMASRLTNLAPPGAVVAPERVVTETASRHRWRDLGRQRPKGIGEDVVVFQLEARNPSSAHK